MTRLPRLAALALAGTMTALTAPAAPLTDSVLARYDLSQGGARFEMPGRLDEISGLALTPDGRLLAHGDEEGTVHVIDPATGEVGKRFTLGSPPVRGDFEGIAAAGERLFLITSTGLLYEFREVGDRESTPYRLTDTRLGARCEIEGLEYDPHDDALLLACKRTSPEEAATRIHRIPLDPEAPRLAPLVVAHEQLAGHDLGEDFHASALAVDPGTGRMLLVAAREEKVIEVDREGRIVAGARLSRRRHPQVEGIAIAPDGVLYLADEKNGRDARLTVYVPVSVSGGP